MPQRQYASRGVLWEVASSFAVEQTSLKRRAPAAVQLFNLFVGAPMIRLGLLIVISALLICSAGAQLKVDVALVNVVATVTDSHGQYVDDLIADDFVLEEDGQVQNIVHLSQSNDLPVSVGILLDSSESMDRKISTASDAVERFIRMIHKNDDIFLMTFDRRPQLRQDFTDHRDKLVSALRRVKLGLGTSLYDAVDEGLQKVKHGMHEKKAILLITDGE